MLMCWMVSELISKTEHNLGSQLIPRAACKVTDLRSCWLKLCFCSEETSAEGNPGACSVSSNHWANSTGQWRFSANRTSEKCSVRLRGDMPPTAWDSRGSKAVTQNARHKQRWGAFHPAAFAPAGWSQSAGFHPGATPQPVPVCLCIETAALSASARGKRSKGLNTNDWHRNLKSNILTPTYKEETRRFHCRGLWKFQR